MDITGWYSIGTKRNDASGIGMNHPEPIRFEQAQIGRSTTLTRPITLVGPSVEPAAVGSEDVDDR